MPAYIISSLSIYMWREVERGGQADRHTHTHTHSEKIIRLIQESYRQVLTPVNNLQRLLRLPIFDKTWLLHSIKHRHKEITQTGFYHLEKMRVLMTLIHCTSLWRWLSLSMHCLIMTKLWHFVGASWIYFFITYTVFTLLKYNYTKACFWPGVVAKLVEYPITGHEITDLNPVSAWESKKKVPIFQISVPSSFSLRDIRHEIHKTSCKLRWLEA